MEQAESDFTKDLLLLMLREYELFVDSFQFACKNFKGNAENAALAQTMGFKSNKEYNDHRELAEEIADFYHTVNMLHPFREGNGRAQRVFFTQWIRSLGYDLDWSRVDPDAFMIATIYAAQGIMDQLVYFFEQTIEQPQTGMRMT